MSYGYFMSFYQELMKPYAFSRVNGKNLNYRQCEIFHWVWNDSYMIHCVSYKTFTQQRLGCLWRSVCMMNKFWQTFSHGGHYM